MSAWRAGIVLGILSWASLLHARAAEASADVRLDKDFIGGILEKLPAATFEQEGQVRGVVHDFRLIAIEARTRQLLVSCQIDGAFHAPVNGLITDRIARSPQTPEGWRKFSFDIKARVNIEPGGDAAPRFGSPSMRSSDERWTAWAGFSPGSWASFSTTWSPRSPTAGPRDSSENLNAEIVRRVSLFKEYGVFCGIDYSQSELVLHFDLTRLRPEGIAGYVFAEPQPGTVPLYRWLHPSDRSHFYTLRPGVRDRPKSVLEGVACHVLDQSIPDAIPLDRWSHPRDHLYMTAPDGEQTHRLGYRPRGIACYVFRESKPGTVPLYRFFDPIRRQHFYTTHAFAEFLK